MVSQNASDSAADSGELDGPPPPKKRRIAEPKPRTTEYLDLTNASREYAATQKKQLDMLLKVLRKRRKIVVVAGAGISVSAGSKSHLFTLRGEWTFFSDLFHSTGFPFFDRSIHDFAQ